MLLGKSALKAVQAVKTARKHKMSKSSWYYSSNLGFVHTEYCTICQSYISHLSHSRHKPLEWAVILEHCERLRAERNHTDATLTQLKKDLGMINDELSSNKGELQFYQDECLKLRTELDSFKSVLDHRNQLSGEGEEIRVESISASPSRRNQKFPKTIAQLQSLMTAAHELGNVRALTKVKALCAEAHATPRELKTPLQQYLLIHWRNPELSNNADGPVQPSIKTNPRRDDPIEVWYDYLCTHQFSWPRGVRRDANNRPLLPDLKASRAVAQLRPPDIRTSSPPSAGAGPAMYRFEFMSILTDLLDQRGLYQKILDKHNVPVSPIVDLRPYSAPFPISVESVVRHLAGCGISVRAADEELEPWAHNYKMTGENSRGYQEPA